ncbi:hypothetical protein L7F22_038519 [Adiantum nelumboides]|nr:hypothetical protein [Adiantum nelumboides]
MATKAPVLGTTEDAPQSITWTYDLMEEDEAEIQTAIQHFSGRTLVGRLVETSPSRPTVREWIQSALGGSNGRILELTMMGRGIYLLQLSDTDSTDALSARLQISLFFSFLVIKFVFSLVLCLLAALYTQFLQPRGSMAFGSLVRGLRASVCTFLTGRHLPGHLSGFKPSFGFMANATGQMGQVLRRLFPFGRGLCHAYWAPNFWALYNASDKMLFYILRKLGFHVVKEKAVMTGGLVGDSKVHAILPQITPGISMLLVLLAMLPCLVKLWKKPHKENLPICVAYAYTCGYIFGWHVHEKAALHFVIPLALAAITSVEIAKEFLFVSTVSYYSLFPLLFEPREYPIKVVMLILHTIVMWLGISLSLRSSRSSAIWKNEKSDMVDKVNSKEKEIWVHLSISKLVFIFGLILVEVYNQMLHHLIFNEKLPFLPLMMISVYCSVGMLYLWIKQLIFVMAL